VVISGPYPLMIPQRSLLIPILCRVPQWSSLGPTLYRVPQWSPLGPILWWSTAEVDSGTYFLIDEAPQWSPLGPILYEFPSGRPWDLFFMESPSGRFRDLLFGSRVRDPFCNHHGDLGKNNSPFICLVDLLISF
jgi:hypothetical protein